MSVKLEGSARKEWRSHWTIALAACAGMASSSSLNYATGLFIEPFQREFGWSRVEITTGPAIVAVICVVGAPFTGAAIDRLGARRIGIFGLFAITLLVSALGAVGPAIESWFAVWTMLGLASLFVLPNVWTAAVSGFFFAGRGLALGLTLCGSGITSIITPILTYWLIQRFGWRLAYPGLALSWAAIALPLLMLFLTSAKDVQRVASTAPDVRPDAIHAAPRKEELLSWRFLQLALAGFLFALVVPPLVISVVPVLTSNGLTRAQAAGTASLLGFSAIGGRLAIGYLLDRVDGRLLAGSIVSLPMATCALLLGMPGSITAATIAVLLLGLALGAEYDIVAYLTSRYFTLGNFGLLFGALAGVIAFAGSGGPLLLSAIYDHYHSYAPALWIAMPLCPIAALLFILLGPYPSRVPRPAVA
ncbi:MFS transporter [Sphingobium tyrosinilyticum]|uniref:MFS transporter n=1 Tax=Sphingobium tyrosinilyticum TaxID=2715436 RepID=A0ABV9F3U5_9SPHN